MSACQRKWWWELWLLRLACQVPSSSFWATQGEPWVTATLAETKSAGFIRGLMSFKKKKMMKLMWWGGMRMLIRYRQALFLFNFYPFCHCECTNSALVHLWGAGTQHFQTAGLCLSLNVLTTSACQLLEGWSEGSPFQPVPTDIREGQDESLLYKYSGLHKSYIYIYVLYNWYKSTSSAKSSSDGSQGYTSSGRSLESPALLECLYVREITAVRKQTPATCAWVVFCTTDIYWYTADLILTYSVFFWGVGEGTCEYNARH